MKTGIRYFIRANYRVIRLCHAGVFLTNLTTICHEKATLHIQPYANFKPFLFGTGNAAYGIRISMLHTDWMNLYPLFVALGNVGFLISTRVIHWYLPFIHVDVVSYIVIISKFSTQPRCPAGLTQSQKRAILSTRVPCNNKYLFTLRPILPSDRTQTETSASILPNVR